MAFRFSLEAVLRVRRGQENAERLKLEAIASELAQAFARYQELTSNSLELLRQFQQRLAGGVAGSEMQLEVERAAIVNAACDSLRAQLLEIEKRRVAQAQIYCRARQNREIVEDLRLRKYDSYRIELGRREQKDLDDLFLMRRGAGSGD